MNPLLFPIVAAQGIWVRLTTEIIPVAAGPSVGAYGEGPSPLRLAVVGESTAAGCGVATHDDGFPGCLARELAARAGRPVAWEAAGQHGAAARWIRHRLVSRLGSGLDLAVLLAGVNDVLTRRTPAQWSEDLTAILDDLATRARNVVVTGIPSFRAFPSLPGTLGRYLAHRATALDSVSRRLCETRARTTFVSSADIAPISPDFFARDGFHPSAAGYRRWARAVADHLTLEDTAAHG